MLLDAAERAAITPLASPRLHALAYLADVLSPVWGLPAFDGKILRIDGGPHYPDLQEELDHLVVMGLVEITELDYVGRGPGDIGARLEGNYALDFASPRLAGLLEALGAEPQKQPLDPEDARVHGFLVELAGALATLPNEEINRATSADVTYRSEGLGENVIDFAAWTMDPWEANPSWRTAERFEQFLPDAANLTGGEKLFLYAAYLGRAAYG
jgi:hypothetical protein